MLPTRCWPWPPQRQPRRLCHFTVRSCLSEAQIASGETFIGSTHQGACTRTFETQTASDLVANLECTGANKMAGSVDVIYGASDKLQLLTRSDITARWLGSDCNSVTASNSRGH